MILKLDLGDPDVNKQRISHSFTHSRTPWSGFYMPFKKEILIFTFKFSYGDKNHCNWGNIR